MWIYRNHRCHWTVGGTDAFEVAEAVVEYPKLKEFKESIKKIKDQI